MKRTARIFTLFFVATASLLLPVAALADGPAADSSRQQAAVSYFDVPAGGVLASLVSAAVAFLWTYATMRKRGAAVDNARMDAVEKRLDAMEAQQRDTMKTFLEENTKLYNRINEVARAVYEQSGTLKTFIDSQKKGGRS